MSFKKKFNHSGNTCTVTFQLPNAIADGAMDVKILGDFNQWDLSKAVTMKQKKGAFEASVNLERNKEHQFRYLIDGNFWQNDPEADKYVPTPFGVENSVVVTSK